LLLTTGISSSAINEDGVRMTSYVPESNAYDIYYPSHYQIYEDETGIVSLFDSVSKLSITISSHALEKKLSGEGLIDLLSGFVGDYFGKKISNNDWKDYKSKFDNLVELTITVDQTNWV